MVQTDIDSIVKVLGLLITAGSVLGGLVWKVSSGERRLEEQITALDSKLSGKLQEVLLAVGEIRTWKIDHDKQDDDREERTQEELTQLRNTQHAHATDIQTVKARCGAMHQQNPSGGR